MRQDSSVRVEEPLPRSAGRTPLLVVLLAATLWGACFCFPQVWRATGIGEGDRMFLDLDGLLAAGEAAQLGLNPFQPNPLDAYHRPHVYTEWWLVTGRLGLTRRDTFWLGAVLTGLTLLSAVLLVRPAGWRQAGLAVLVLVSPAMLLAVNRANNDLVVFILMGGALVLLRQDREPPRVLGVVLLAIAAVLKYYPLAAGVILLDARSRREWLGWILAYGLVLLLAWPALEPGLHSASKYRPSPDWLYAFGMPVIFRDFALAVPPGWLAFGGGLAVAGWAARGALKGGAANGAPSAAEREFACGAALLVGCFALGSSYAYKLVFSVWLLPWLWRTVSPGQEDLWRRATLGLLLVVLWLEGLLSVVINVLMPPGEYLLALQVMKATLAISQVLTWALVISLLRSVLIYAGPRVIRLATG
jgi:hypothetical protein